MPIIAGFESDIREVFSAYEPVRVNSPIAYVDEYNGIVAGVRYARWRQYGEIFLLDKELLPEPIYPDHLNSLMDKSKRHATILPFFKFRHPMQAIDGEPGHLVLQNLIGAEEIFSSLNYVNYHD